MLRPPLGFFQAFFPRARFTAGGHGNEQSTAMVSFAHDSSAVGRNEIGERIATIRQHRRWLSVSPRCERIDVFCSFTTDGFFVSGSWAALRFQLDGLKFQGRSSSIRLLG